MGQSFFKTQDICIGQYESLMGKYSDEGGLKTKFGVSTQHYSFAIKAFVEMVKKFDMMSMILLSGRPRHKR